ncbi:MAG TPA: diaminopimelate decarboxylase [Acidothermaceae bacterium]|nr:diaminopimelate decarboxylase [Acidothermaceae bacterium]
MHSHVAGALHADAREPLTPPPVAPADVNALDATVWSQNVSRSDAGVLTIAGVAATDLARDFGTPAFVVDEADFRARCRAWVRAFPDADVFYAGKAFLTIEIARWVADEGLGLDVCTGGELALALRAGFEPGRIALHGNNKSVLELRTALDAAVGRIVVDSFEEIDRLVSLAEGRATRPRVLVRTTVGVEAHTHEFIATAHEDQKFGFSLAGGAAKEAARRVLESDTLELVGLHSHIGSQIFDTAGFEVSAHRVVGLLREIRDDFGVELPELDLGGGVGVAYVPADDPPEIAYVAAQLRDIIERECDAASLTRPRLTVEPGRAICGPSTFTLYEVGTIKPIEVGAGVVRTYVSVDGGMSDNIRTALYDATYSCTVANRASVAPPVLSRVVGKHCESGDIVVRDTFLPSDVTPGDLVAVPVTGAYCRSLASNYNYLGRPPVVAVRDGVARVIVRRETIDDLLRLDVE